MNSAAKTSWEEAVCWLRDQPEQQQLVLDAFYDDPLIAAAERYYGSPEWQEVSRLLSDKRGNALDVGAGRGIASYALARLGFKVTALEPDPSAIVGAAAIRRLSTESDLNIEVVEQFSEQLPFADTSFDVVFARAVLHHTRNLTNACREMHRVLKPGGLLIAAREHVITKDTDLPKFLALHPLHHLYGGENAFRLDCYLGALKEARFRSIEVLAPLKSPINLYPYTVDSIREELIAKCSRKVPFPTLIRAVTPRKLIEVILSVGTHFDNRPGRLYSFVAYK
ncbi:class I SAM-dependent methyltransferase [Bradyrhizobium sp. I1.7.5]|uniref:class I SAM-dependent methyltransferase n=1 Tax=Bradyrhizobium sp. I1.7.5 TaxID=3156363 RepID=UPI003394B676